MKKLFTLVLLSLITFNVYGFTDSDFDGVDDSVDKCPHTPFDVLVGSDGCPLEKYRGTFYFKLGVGYTKDNDYNNSLINASLGYAYKNWYVSILSNYYTNDSDLDKSGVGDTYLYGSYTFSLNNFYITPGLTLKIPTASDGFGTGNYDVSPSLTADYIFSKLDIFAYYGYIFRGSDDLDDNYTISLGLGYQITDPLYLSLSFDTDKNESKYLSLFGIYDFTDKYYSTLNLSYGLNDLSTDLYVSLKFGIRF